MHLYSGVVTKLCKTEEGIPNPQKSQRGNHSPHDTLRAFGAVGESKFPSASQVHPKCIPSVGGFLGRASGAPPHFASGGEIFIS